MAETPKRLIGPKEVATAAATEYTVPGATTTIVRNIHACNTTASAKALTLSIGADAAGKRLLSALSIPANSNYDWNGWEVMTAAEIIQAFSDVAGVTLTVAGVELT